MQTPVGPGLSPAELTHLVQDAGEGAARRFVGLVVGAFSGASIATLAVGMRVQDGEAVTRDTIFQIGSVTKVFTALALAAHVVEGTVSLDTPLSTVLPEARPSKKGSHVTLGQLASHTAGLPRLPKGLRRRARHHRDDPYCDFSTDDLLAALAAATPHPEPGTTARYSNFGAALLGEALSRLDGVPYDEVIARRVTRPLRLTDTVITLSPGQAQRTATSHSRRRKPVPDWDLGAMPGAGALRSTVDDLLALLRAHLEPEGTLTPQALRLVQQPLVRVNRWVQVGLGWHLSPVRGTDATALWHNGATAGSRSYVGLAPSADAGVVVLTNTGRSPDALGIGLLGRLVDGSKTAPLA